MLMQEIGVTPAISGDDNIHKICILNSQFRVGIKYVTSKRPRMKVQSLGVFFQSMVLNDEMYFLHYKNT